MQHTVGIRGQDVIAVHHCQRVRKQQFLQIISVASEQLAVDRSVSHFISLNLPSVNARMTILEQDADNAIEIESKL